MGRAIRWQAVLALLGIVLLAAILAGTVYQVTSTMVPARGGTYTEAVVGSPQLINPIIGFPGDLDRDLIGLIYQGLVRLDERSEVQPSLAESWQISPDGLTYTFRLRRDVRWHDGAPFSADDVLFTINTLQSDEFSAPEFPAPAFLPAFWRAVETTKLDDTTIQFTLQQPYSPFLYETTIGILPAHLWRNIPVAQMPGSLLNQQPVGSGPWRLAALSAVGARLEPNPYAWDMPTPYLEGLELRFFPDYDSAFAAFAAGEVDGVSRITGQNLALAQASAAMEVLSAPLAGQTFAYFNLDNANTPFFGDVRVRQALWLGLDLQGLIDGALAGQAVPADGPFMPGTWAYVQQPRPAADPDQARELLEEAGWTDEDGDGVRQQGEMTLSFDLLGDNEAVLEALADQWGAIGVLARPQPLGLIELVAEHLNPRDYEAALVHWQLAGDPDPYPLWHSTQAGDGQNYTGWRLRQADEMMEQGRSAVDPGRRMQIYEAFQALFRQELPALPLYFDVYSFGVNERVHDVSIGRLNEPVDRFRSLPKWYIQTERVTSEAE